MKTALLLAAMLIVPSSAFPQWTRTNGPEGISMESLAYIDGTIYAGTATDGLYGSTDDGVNWLPLNSGIETEDVTAIVNLPGYVLIGTFGSGVFRSTDAGQTWLPPSNGNGLYVSDMVVKDSYVFVGTNFDGVYRSSDSGETWEQVLEYYSILSMGVSGNRIFAARYGSTFVSTDNGESWSDVIDLSGAAPWSFYSEGNLVIAGCVNEIYRSTNQGAQFSRIPLSFPFSIVNIHSITSSGSALFMGTSYDGVYKSIDDGLHWFAANEGMGPKDVRALTATESATVIAGAHYVGVFRSTDQGAGWNKSMSGFPAGLTIASILSTEAGVFAGTRDGVYRTTDNGATWLELAANDTIDYALVRGLCEKELPSVGGDRVIFASTILQFNATVYKTDDNGLTWTRSGSGLPSDLTFINALATSGNNVIAATSEGAYYSSDNGNSWHPSNLPAEYIEDLAASGGYAYAIAGAGIYRSANDGVSWSIVLPSTVDYVSLAAKDNFVYAGSFFDGVRYSTNFGSSWQPSSGFPFETSVFGTGPTGDGVVVAGTDLEPDHIYVSFDNGGHFSPYSEGLGRWAYAESFAVNDLFIFAATAYNGVWRRLRPGAAAIDEPADVAQTLHLTRNVPNPFNPTTRIEYTLPAAGEVSLKVYDALGNEIKTLLDETQPGGERFVVWDGTDNHGRAVSSGIYFYRLQSDNVVVTRNMMLLK
jgi:photosystem II stability/assembly factor-like uncharacterized protein